MQMTAHVSAGVPFSTCSQEVLTSSWWAAPFPITAGLHVGSGEPNSALMLEQQPVYPLSCFPSPTHLRLMGSVPSWHGVLDVCLCPLGEDHFSECHWEQLP